MKEKQNEELFKGNKNPFYSDEFKKKVAKEVFEGKFTQSEARRIYGIGGKSTILAWMKKWDLIPNSCSLHQPRHYSDAFKRKVVQDVLAGKFTKSEARRIYGVGNKNTIFEWMKKYKMVTNYSYPDKLHIAERTMENKEEEFISKEQKIIALEKALEKEKNKSALFEKIIEIAEEEYGLSIRKKSEAKQFSNLNVKKEKK